AVTMKPVKSKSAADDDLASDNCSHHQLQTTIYRRRLGTARAIPLPFCRLGCGSLLIKKSLFNILVDSHQPRFGALRAFLGALRAILVVAHIEFKFLDPLFGRAQL